MAISNLASGFRPGVCTSTTRPTTPFEGQMIYETDTNRVLVYDNAAWVMIADTDQPPGLQLIKTQTIGSAVTSVTLTNVFSSEFENYKVVIRGGTQTASNGLLTAQLRTGSTTSTTGYYYSLIYSPFTGSVLAVNGNNTTGWAYFAHSLGSSGWSASVDILGPFVAEPTSFFGGASRADISGMNSGYHSASTSYDQLVLTVGSGTMTGGTIRVYGYRDS